MRAIQWSLLLSVLLCSSGCFSYQEVVFNGVEDVKVDKLGLSGFEGTVHANITNPNGYRIHGSNPDLDLYLNGKHLGRVRLKAKLRLDRRSTKTYAIPLRTELDNKGAPLMGLLGAALTGSAELEVKGTVTGRIGLLRRKFPFEGKHRVDLR